MVATDAARELNDVNLRRAAKHLCHSTETSRQYYEFSNNDDTVLAHQALYNVSKKRKWSKQHITALLKEWPLTSSVQRDIKKTSHEQNWKASIGQVEAIKEDNVVDMYGGN